MYKIRFADGREYQFKTRDEYEEKRNELREQATNPPVPVNFPGTKELASNLVGTAADLLTGGVAPAAIARARLDVCMECPYFENASGRCKLCGCFMKVKAKVALAECPAKKWPGERHAPMTPKPKDTSDSFAIRNPNRSSP